MKLITDKMKGYLAGLCLLIPFATQASETVNESIMATVIWHKGNQKQIVNTNQDKIEQLSLQLFSEANDRYRYLVTPKHLADVRRQGSLEIILTPPRKVTSKVIPQEIELTRLLIPRHNSTDLTPIIIYFADPEYNDFNCVISTNGVSIVKEIYMLADIH